jgi:hypothetical protein
MLLAQGRFRQASASFARSWELLLELAVDFAASATLVKANSVLGRGVARAAAWLRLAALDELLGATGLTAIADDVEVLFF